MPYILLDESGDLGFDFSKEKTSKFFVVTFLFNDLAHKDVRILSIWLNKSKVYTKLQNEKQVLYNYVTNILLDRAYSGRLIPADKTITLMASKRETNKFLNENFKTYPENQVIERHRIQLQIQIKTPAEEKALQMADFVCWAIFRRREFGDDEYWRLIRGKIVEESPLFP